MRPSLTMANDQELTPPSTPTAARLLGAVIAKAFLELLFVCTVITLAAFSNFNPSLRGEIENADAQRVEGWVHDPLAGTGPMDVQLWIDHRFFATMRTEDETGAEAIQNGKCKFQFTLGTQLSPGRHRAEVYVVRKTARGYKTLLPISKQKRFFEVAN
jgi:hypothetical protein